MIDRGQIENAKKYQGRFPCQRNYEFCLTFNLDGGGFLNYFTSCGGAAFSSAGGTAFSPAGGVASWLCGVLTS